VTSTTAEPTALGLQALLERRTAANRAFFAAEAERASELCHRMAERFARGGRLLAVGCTETSRSDARHVAVEFVHPVIVGKRALPALALTGEARQATAELGLLARSNDMVLAFPPAPEDRAALAAAVRCARVRGCLTVAFSALDAEWELEPPSGDERVCQELVETLYHVLWELVHVFFDHRGVLEGRETRSRHDAGASSFLYPFLAEHEGELGALLRDVRDSALLKAGEIGALRAQTITESRDVLLDAAAGLRERFERGGKLLALGNGGSATDAMDVVADFRASADDEVARPAIDLTGDPAILTAIANDIGIEAIFSRQVIAYGQPDDALLALSTSGNSPNVTAALAQARRQGLLTVAFVGYDGGAILADRLADHVIVTRSEHIPRIQEAQATAYHALRELIGGADGAAGGR
jgi:D-sedoheptulose 7-phosphate isomerase